MGEVTVQSLTCGSNILSVHIPFVPCQSGIPFLSNNFFQNLIIPQAPYIQFIPLTMHTFLLCVAFLYLVIDVVNLSIVS